MIFLHSFFLLFNQLAEISLKRNICCFLFFLLSLFLLSQVVFSSREEVNIKRIIAEEVFIPKYGDNGQIIWTLNAEEVNPGARDSYNVVGPILKTLDQRKNITQVSAPKGVFDLEKDRAFGSEKINSCWRVCCRRQFSILLVKWQTIFAP